MPTPLQTDVRNRLLMAMTEKDFALLAKSLSEVELAVGEALIEPDTPVPYAWFPESGVCSVIASTASGRQTDVALIGREGIVDIIAIHGTDRSPLLCFMQIAGTAWRLRADVLRRAVDESDSLRDVLLHYAQSMFIQVAHTALSNATYPIAQRLARWLLISQDRLDASEIRFTHERLSLMLGVSRAGVTVAIQALERGGLIDARRGALSVVDRPRLVSFAGGSYGAYESEYERLLGFALTQDLRG